MITMKKLSEEEIKKEREEAKLQMGRLLSKEREKLRLSLEQVGGELGISAQSVHYQETGQTEVRQHHIRTYSRIYNKPISYFYGEGTDAKAIMIAAEATHLPNEVSISIFQLIKTMNQALKKEQTT